MFVTFIFVFENSQNSFWCGLFFGSFWYVKYLNFGQKLPIRTANHTFLESRHPEVTKNLYYVLSTHQRQIPSFLGCSLWAIDFVLILFPCLLHFANTFEVSMNWNSQVCCHCPFFNSVVILRCTNYFPFCFESRFITAWKENIFCWQEHKNWLFI